MLKYVFLHIVLLKFKNIYLPTINIRWLVVFRLKTGRKVTKVPFWVLLLCIKKLRVCQIK